MSPPVEIDPQRTVKAVRDRVEGGIGGVNIGNPGEMRPLVELDTDTGERRPSGYILFCPGCGRRLHVQTAGPGPHWTQSGDLDAGTLTLTPSLHDAGEGSCGWHGWLTLGMLRPV